MSSRSIRLSEKHGVNPSILHCPICGKETGIGLLGKLKGDAEAPRDMIDRHPCDNCQKVIDGGGHFIIEVRDGESGNNPYRTGRLIGITNEAAERLFTIRPVPPVAYMEQSPFGDLFGEALKEKEQTNDKE